MSHKWTGTDAAIVLIALVIVATICSYIVIGTAYPMPGPMQKEPAITQTPCDCACGYTQIKVNGYASNGYGNEMTVYDRYFNPYHCVFWICNGIERNGCYEALIFTDRAGEKHIVSMELISDCNDCITGQCSNEG